MSDSQPIPPYSTRYAEAHAALKQVRSDILRAAPRPGTVVRGSDRNLYRVTYIHVMTDGTVALDGNWQPNTTQNPKQDWTMRAKRVPAPWSITP